MPLMQPMGLPPLPKGIQAPEEMDISEGPDGIEVQIEGLDDAVTHMLKTTNEDDGTHQRTEPVKQTDE